MEHPGLYWDAAYSRNRHVVDRLTSDEVVTLREESAPDGGI